MLLKHFNDMILAYERILASEGEASVFESLKNYLQTKANFGIILEKHHVAFRYLSNPNPYMDQDVGLALSYGIPSEIGVHSDITPETKRGILCLWLRVQDKSAALPEAFPTIESLTDFFVETVLADVARRRNRDHEGNPLDDGGRDKPTDAWSVKSTIDQFARLLPPHVPKVEVVDGASKVSEQSEPAAKRRRKR